MLTSTRLDEAKIYTMRQLNQDTGGVLREIEEAGQAALVTRRGRFVVMIKPAASSNFEAKALSVLLATGEFREQYFGQRTADGILTSTEVLSDLRDDKQRGRTADPSRTGGPQFYSLRELSHRTSHVIREINERDQRGYLTRRGRLLAVMLPLASARLEEAALAAVLAKANATDTLSSAAEGSVGSHEAATDLGVHYRH